MGPLEVRLFTDSDLPGAVKALVEVHGTDGYPVEGVDDPESWLRSERVEAAWVAHSEGEVVGHVALMNSQGDADSAARLWIEQSGESAATVLTLARLFVVRSARKRATGERLTRAVMDHCREEGKSLVLEVLIKDRAAKRLYERLGWRRIGTVAHEYGEGQSMQALCYAAPLS